MYSLLIVDDEPLVREGLRRSIAWEELGFQIVGEAANGVEALKIAESLKPDVMITDMRMTVMDGTELIENAVRQHPQMQLVIMTAYNEFAFAKTAIDYNVFAFITKPAPNAEICRVFERLRRKMDQEKSLSDKLRSYHSYRADELFSRIIFSEEDTGNLTGALRECLTAEPQQSFFVALLEIAASGGTANARQLYQLLNEKLEYSASTFGSCICKSRLSDTQAVLLVFTEAGDVSAKTAFLQDIQQKFEQESGVQLTVGISSAFQELSNIRKAFRQSAEALRFQSHSGTGKIIDYHSVSRLRSQTPSLTPEDIERVLKGLLEEEREACFGFVQTYFAGLSDINADIRIVKTSMTELCTTVLRSLFRNYYTIQLVFGKAIRPAADLQGLNTLTEIFAYLLRFLERTELFVSCMKPVLGIDRQYRPVVSEAVAFIAENYSNKVRIPDIAERLHISESRLIHLFKEDTGFTINEFLTEYRIRLAQILIRSRAYNLYEIADLVGYENPITFRKAFCKIVGTIPSRYSAQTGESHEVP